MKIVWGRSIFVIPNIYSANWFLSVYVSPPDRKAREGENVAGKRKRTLVFLLNTIPLGLEGQPVSLSAFSDGEVEITEVE